MDEKTFRSLLEEFQKNRSDLHTMVEDIEVVKKRIEDLIPEKLEARYKMFFEERVKTIVSMFNLLLDLRKEISRSLKDEVEMRRRLASDEKDQDVDALFDVSSLAAKVEELTRESDKKKTKLRKKKRALLTEGEA